MNTVTVHNQKGFTLVEIAIVLVIIGLLLGGVLKGQELIVNSKIKGVTGDLEGVAAAYYAYQDRTGNVAGDSDNDGQIDDNSQFWNDLRREGFISGAATASGTTATGPRHDLDGVFTAHSPDLTAAVVFGTRNFICASNIENSVAQGMDTKLDDGVGDTGSIRSSIDDLATFEVYVPATPDDETIICKEL